jgi:hypothetical protein
MRGDVEKKETLLGNFLDGMNFCRTLGQLETSR